MNSTAAKFPTTVNGFPAGITRWGNFRSAPLWVTAWCAFCGTRSAARRLQQSPLRFIDLGDQTVVLQAGQTKYVASLQALQRSRGDRFRHHDHARRKLRVIQVHACVKFGFDKSRTKSLNAHT